MSDLFPDLAPRYRTILTAPPGQLPGWSSWGNEIDGAAQVER